MTVGSNSTSHLVLPNTLNLMYHRHRIHIASATFLLRKTAFIRDNR